MLQDNIYSWFLYFKNNDHARKLEEIQKIRMLQNNI